jgi:hypothetical protein
MVRSENGSGDLTRPLHEQAKRSGKTWSMDALEPFRPGFPDEEDVCCQRLHSFSTLGASASARRVLMVSSSRFSQRGAGFDSCGVTAQRPPDEG